MGVALHLQRVGTYLLRHEGMQGDLRWVAVAVDK
jgi:hypothetical protein